MEPLLAWLSQWGYFGLFGLLVFGIVGLPIPDETLLVIAGYLISQGSFHPAVTWLAGFLGAACGISASYWLGRTAGHTVITRYGRWLHLTPQRMDQVNAWFGRVGNWLLTIGYFIPGVRHFTALVAGMSGLEFRTFALFAYPGAAVWVTTFLVLGRMVGKNWKQAVQVAHHYTLLVCGIGLVIGIVAFSIVRMRSRYNAE